MKTRQLNELESSRRRAWMRFWFLKEKEMCMVCENKREIHLTVIVAYVLTRSLELVLLNGRRHWQITMRSRDSDEKRDGAPLGRKKQTRAFSLFQEKESGEGSRETSTKTKIKTNKLTKKEKR